ncbi:GNAT family N-acetyltransferase [Bremerella alba]|uniref:N-acetyltransferase domain-containing protein n=1 Tax=Bremerella alba TaxID=980252 RepID=A0A7V8V5F4_9BACT|nr:GNAT family N-acetyltransferase [Bremerella alba]MBA2115186.1 hypothetical protein [Bremerella alba]
MTTRNMTQEEVVQLVEWAAQEGWNPGLCDAERFWATDPEGFMAIDVDGQMAGAGCAFYHGPEYGFMGLFIMLPEFRGQGLGRTLWYARRDKLRSRLSADATIGMDAVTNMIPFYAEGGFEVFARHCRFTLSAENVSVPENPAVVRLTEPDLAEVRALDRRGFPCEREKYLGAWTTQPNAYWLGLPGNNGLEGYSVMRLCRSGWKVGPLMAAGKDQARQLLLACIARAERGPVFIDVPDNNPAAWSLCEEFNMEQVFECTRMYFGPAPELDHAWIYGVTSLEAG